jgi:hypothetical protein
MAMATVPYPGHNLNSEIRQHLIGNLLLGNNRVFDMLRHLICAPFSINLDESCSIHLISFNFAPTSHPLLYEACLKKLQLILRVTVLLTRQHLSRSCSLIILFVQIKLWYVKLISRLW